MKCRLNPEKSTRISSLGLTLDSVFDDSDFPEATMDALKEKGIVIAAAKEKPEAQTITSAAEAPVVEAPVVEAPAAEAPAVAPKPTVTKTAKGRGGGRRSSTSKGA